MAQFEYLEGRMLVVNRKQDGSPTAASRRKLPTQAKQNAGDAKRYRLRDPESDFVIGSAPGTWAGNPDRPQARQEPAQDADTEDPSEEETEEPADDTGDQGDADADKDPTE